VTFDQLAPSTLAFAAAPTVTGDKTHVELTCKNKPPPIVQLAKPDAPLRIPFGLSTPYGDEEGNQRHTLDVSAPPELAAWAAGLDEQLVQHAIKHSDAWFGRALDEATIRTMHHPLVRPSDKYEPLLRLKASPKAVKLWRAADRAPVTVDELVRDATVVPLVTLGNAWILDEGRLFGLTLGMKAALVAPSLGLDAFVGLEPMEE
jgi:hypothetical protein